LQNKGIIRGLRGDRWRNIGALTIRATCGKTLQSRATEPAAISSQEVAMKFRNGLFTACVVAAMFCSFLNAQQPAASTSSVVVPRLVSFSGRAVDSQGKIITGIAGASFAIYQDQFEGTPLWMETQNIQADAKGTYTVQLGATKSQGLPLEVFSTGQGHWLGAHQRRRGAATDSFAQRALRAEGGGCGDDWWPAAIGIRFGHPSKQRASQRDH
jgi:hypothetical protein